MACLSLPSLSAAKLEYFELDPVHTRVAFQVSHAGFSNPVGTFSGSTGTLSFDEDDWSSAQLSVQIPITSLDLGDANWQKKVLDPTFFNSEKFPDAQFVSTQVEKTGENTAQVVGELTLHGVTRPVTLAVTLNSLRRHPLTFKTTAGFSATATISRKDFDMGAWKSVVGDEVHLIIEAEALRARAKSSEQLIDSENPTETDDDVSN